MIDRPFRDTSSPTNDLPASGGQSSSSVIDRSVARATFFRLEEAGSQIPGRVREQIEHLYKELLVDLGHHEDDDMIILSPDQFRGVVASALITGAAQATLPNEATEPDTQTEDMPPEDVTDEPLAPVMEAA